MLSNIQDLKSILNDLSTIMSDSGSICFVDYTDFYKIIPNVEWLSNDKYIEELFKKAGFSVQIRRDKGLLWTTVYIYGIKSNDDDIVVI